MTVNNITSNPLIKVLAAVFCFFCFLFMISNFGYQLLNLTYETASDLRLSRAVLIQVFLDLVAILMVISFYKAEGKSISNIKFVFNKKIAGLTLIIISIILIQYLALILISAYRGTAEWEFAQSVSIRYILQTVIVFGMIGLGEEMLFRGYVFKTLLSYGRMTAYLISSLLFAVPHFIGGSFNLNRMIILMVLSVYFAYIYDKSGSIIPGVIIHTLMDLVGFLVIKNQSGISVFSYTGSIEALNYISMIAIVAQFIIIHFLCRNNKGLKINKKNQSLPFKILIKNY